MNHLASPPQGHSTPQNILQGQRHERIVSSQRDAALSGSGETSLSQKMLSAVTGSILTSLLGTSCREDWAALLAHADLRTVTPLDVVRVRQQAQPSPSPSTSTEFVRLPPKLGISTCCRNVFWVQNQSQFCVASPTAAAVDEVLLAECAAEETQKRVFNSTLDGMRKIARNEGITTLWRGLSPTLAMAIPGNVIYFAGYDWMRLNDNSPIKGRVSDAYAPLVAGSLARVMAAIAISPIEMLRTRMQASHPSNTGAVLRQTVTGLKEMVADNGYRSLWRGLTLTFWRDVPFSAFYWWGYEYGRDKLHEMRNPVRSQELDLQGSPKVRGRSRDHELDHKTVLIESFVSGAGAGAIAAFFTTPFDVGKTRQQTAQHTKKDASKGTIPAVLRPEERSMPRFLLHIYQNEGTAGLFKGWAARCMKVAPACAIMISSYELGKKMAIGMNEKSEFDV